MLIKNEKGENIMVLPSFPKIFAIGSDYISHIFNEDVEITEKIDGSQFIFGKIDGELYIRSKGAEISINNPQKMFIEGVDYIEDIAGLIPEGRVFYCEYLRKPKHNILAYDRIPSNHLVLFGVKYEGKFISSHKELSWYASDLGIDSIPLIYSGKVKSPDELFSYLERDSYLGGKKIEGVVVKNYERPFLLGGQPIPLMAGKYVSEEFKEVHRNNWKTENTPRGKFDVYKTQFNTEARWNKAVQRLSETGTLTNSPKDIGNLIKSVHVDVTEEEKENIKNFLWKEFGGEILRYSTRGLPEWYKKLLVKRFFN